jgi:hypothetical protein
VVCNPGPRRPVGENNPGNVSALGMTINDVNKYPLARTNSALRRTMLYIENNKIAVMRSLMRVVIA